MIEISEEDIREGRTNNKRIKFNGVVDQQTVKSEEIIWALLLRLERTEARIKELGARLKAINEGGSYEDWPDWMKANAYMASASVPRASKKESGNG